ncbi:MAG: hypothetical protein J6S27_01420 [Thermoguttaceae bacterium]|nr:hypothetical protein [Thermoguttaceae bacterium]
MSYHKNHCFCAALLFAAAVLVLSSAALFAQSDQFGEKVNENFVEAIQPGLLEQAADSATSPYDFMLLAKRIGVYGDASAAAAMGKWLGDPDKSLSARNALEEMPFEEALAELRAGVASVEDPVLKAGCIDSLGMRRDCASIEALLPLLDSEEAVIAEAAFFALARIADPSYRDTLTGKLAQGDGKCADKCLMYGEFLRRDGNEADAIAVFDAVAAAAPLPFYREAACFQILLVETDDALARAAEWLAGSDATAYRATLRAAQYVKSDKVCDVLLAAYNAADNARKPALLAAMGDQKNPRCEEAILGALSSDDEAVRAAAMKAILSFSNVEAMNRMIDAAAAGDEALRAETVKILGMFDVNVDPAIEEMLAADPVRRDMAIELVGLHKIGSARAKLAELLPSLEEVSLDKGYRALGFVADLDAVKTLCEAYAATGSPAALDGLTTAIGMVPDKDGAAAILDSVIDGVTDKDRAVALTKLFARFGTPAALAAVEKRAVSGDALAKDAATQALGAWMSIDAVPLLLKLSDTPNYPHAARTLSGALRLARQFAMPDQQRVEVVKAALASKVCNDKHREVADIIVKQYHLNVE